MTEENHYTVSLTVREFMGRLIASESRLAEQNTELQRRMSEMVCEHRARKGIQKRIGCWVEETLSCEHAEAGLSSLPWRKERAVRFVEEAIELAQAIGVDREQLHRLVDYVMDRPVGEVAQEVGGSMLTLYAVSEACGVDADAQALREIERVETPEVRAKVRRRQAEKRAALVGK